MENWRVCVRACVRLCFSIPSWSWRRPASVPPVPPIRSVPHSRGRSRDCRRIPRLQGLRARTLWKRDLSRQRVSSAPGIRWQVSAQLWTDLLCVFGLLETCLWCCFFQLEIFVCLIRLLNSRASVRRCSLQLWSVRVLLEFSVKAGEKDWVNCARWNMCCRPLGLGLKTHVHTHTHTRAWLMVGVQCQVSHWIPATDLQPSC